MRNALDLFIHHLQIPYSPYISKKKLEEYLNELNKVDLKIAYLKDKFGKHFENTSNPVEVVENWKESCKGLSDQSKINDIESRIEKFSKVLELVNRFVADLPRNYLDGDLIAAPVEASPRIQKQIEEEKRLIIKEVHRQRSIIQGIDHGINNSNPSNTLETRFDESLFDDDAEEDDETKIRQLKDQIADLLKELDNAEKGIRKSQESANELSVKVINISSQLEEKQRLLKAITLKYAADTIERDLIEDISPNNSIRLGKAGKRMGLRQVFVQPAEPLDISKCYVDIKNKNLFGSNDKLNFISNFSENIKDIPTSNRKKLKINLYDFIHFESQAEQRISELFSNNAFISSSGCMIISSFFKTIAGLLQKKSATFSFRFNILVITVEAVYIKHKESDWPMPSAFSLTVQNT